MARLNLDEVYTTGDSGTVLIPKSRGGPFYDVMAYGAVGDGVTDDTAAIQGTIDAAALAASAGKSGATVLLQAKYKYLISDQLSISASGIRLAGSASGRILTGPTLLWGGDEDDAAVMLYVAAGTHGVTIEGLLIEGADKAGTLVHVDGTSGSATHRPHIRNLRLTGYRVLGAALGGIATKAEMDGDTVTLNSVQFQQAVMEDVAFKATVDGSRGLLLNAQNCEWLHLRGCTFDGGLAAESSAYHTNHIYQRTGGILATGLETTRCKADVTGDDYGWAIHSYGQLAVHGWRSEDRFLVYQAAVAGEGMDISGLTQRAGNGLSGGTNLATDDVIYVRQTGGPVYLRGKIQGRVRVASTNAYPVNADMYHVLGGDYLLDEPSAANALLRNAESGRVRHYIGGKLVSDTSSSGVAITGTRQVAEYATPFVPDPRLGRTIEITLTGNISINAMGTTVAKPGDRVTFVFIQDGTGGRTVTFTSSYKANWTPSTTAGKINTITFECRDNAGPNQWVQVASAVGL